MASLQEYKSLGNSYLRIVESYRDPVSKKPKTKILVNLGNSKNISFDTNKIRLFLKDESYSEDVYDLLRDKLSDRYEIDYKNYGYLLYKSIWDKLGVKNIIDNFQKDTDISYSVSEVCEALVLFRLIYPTSKLKVYENQTELLGFYGINLQYIYRSLSFLSENVYDLLNVLDDRINILYNKTDNYEAICYNLFENYLNVYTDGVSLNGKKFDTIKVFGLDFSINERYIHPVYVYSDDSVKGHIFVCVIAHVIDRLFYKEIKSQTRYSYDFAKYAINNAMVDVFDINGIFYYLKREEDVIILKLFEIFNIDKLSNFSKI